MSIRIVRRGNTGQSNDHNLLINRGERDQHPIESITGLRSALALKYEKPKAGIPKADLGFSAVDNEQLQGVRNEFVTNVDDVLQEQVVITNRVLAVEAALANMDDANGGDIPNVINIIETSGFYETTAVSGQKQFDLSFTYVPGTNQLEVFIDGVLAAKDLYIESNETTLTFVKGMYGGEVVTAKADVSVKLTSPIHQSMLYDGNQVVTLEHKYNVGDNSLSVYCNGRRLDVGVDYTELNATQIKIIDPSITTGARLTCRRETHMAGQLSLIELDKAYMTWSQKIMPEADQRTIISSKSFLVSGNMIQVFCNGLLMEEGASGDYLEISQTSIKFNYDLEAEDEVRIVCNAGQMQWKEKFVVLNNEKQFRLSNPYNPGLEEIEVYENGVLLSSGEDYTEPNRTTVALSQEPEHGSVIIVFRRR